MLDNSTNLILFGENIQIRKMFEFINKSEAAQDILPISGISFVMFLNCLWCSCSWIRVVIYVTALTKCSLGRILKNSKWHQNTSRKGNKRLVSTMK